MFILKTNAFELFQFITNNKKIKNNNKKLHFFNLISKCIKNVDIQKKFCMP